MIRAIERAGPAWRIQAVLRIVIALCAPGLLAQPAAAQAGGDPGESPGSDQPPSQQPPDWIVTVGGSAVIAPRYEGSRSMNSLAFPFLSVTFKDRVFLSAADGLGVYLLKAGPLRLGTAFSYSPGRAVKYPSFEDNKLKMKSDRVLRGWGHVDPAPALQAFVLFMAGPVGLKASVRHAVGGGDGTLVDLTASTQFPIGSRLVIPLHAGLTWSDARYNRTFFGVTPAQSARAAEAGVSIAPHTVGAGMKSASLGSGNQKLAMKPTVYTRAATVVAA